MTPVFFFGFVFSSFVEVREISPGAARNERGSGSDRPAFRPFPFLKGEGGDGRKAR